MKKRFIICLVLGGAFFACKKAEPKGDILLSDDFDAIGNWELYSEYSPADSFYSRIEDGMLKMQTYANRPDCQRATYYFQQDLSAVERVEVAVYCDHLLIPDGAGLYIYCSLGDQEFRATIEKEDADSFTIWIKLHRGKVISNLRGVIFDEIAPKKEKDNHASSFIQLSLCGIENGNSAERVYLQVDRLIIGTK